MHHHPLLALAAHQTSPWRKRLIMVVGLLWRAGDGLGRQRWRGSRNPSEYGWLASFSNEVGKVRKRRIGAESRTISTGVFACMRRSLRRAIQANCWSGTITYCSIVLDRRIFSGRERVFASRSSTDTGWHGQVKSVFIVLHRLMNHSACVYS